MTSPQAHPPLPQTEPYRYARWLVAGAVCCSALLSCIYLYQIEDAPFFSSLILDEAAYDARARAILGGDWLLTSEGIFYQDPLYPYLLALFYLPTGPSAWGAHLWQLLFDPLMCVLTYLLGRGLFSPRVGAWASCGAAVYLPFYFFGGLLHKALPATAVFTGVLVVLTRARGRLLWYGAIGVLLGTGALLRGNFLALIPVAVVIVAWSQKIHGRDAPRRWQIRHAGALLMGSALVILPVTLRNYVLGKDFVLVTFQGGPNMYIGNHPGNTTGSYQAPPFVRGTPEFERTDFTREAKKRTEQRHGAAANGAPLSADSLSTHPDRRAQPGLKPSEVNRFWYAETARYVATQPGEALRNVLAKMALIVSTEEVSDNIPYSFYRERYAPLLRAPLLTFGIVFPFALIGLVSALRSASTAPKTNLPGILALMGVYAVTLCASFVVGRYRLPLVPVVLVFGAYGVHTLWKSAREHQWRPRALALPAALLIVGMLASHLPVRQEHNDTPYYVLGNLYVRHGKIAPARKEYEAALAINPANVHALLNLGWTYYDTGDAPRAASYFLRAHGVRPAYPNVHLALAMTAYAQGYTEGARFHLRRAAELHPADGRIIQNGIALARRLGEDELAEKFQALHVPASP